jgi:GntR family transcriptional regulator of arabinose operon
MGEFRLRRKGYQPLYEQIRDYIRSQIVSGELPPGYPLPNASELTEKFGVSTITTNRALIELANEGLVTRIPGQGTFVANVQEISISSKAEAEVLVGVIVPNLTWPLSSGILHHIEKQARARGCMLLFRGTENTIESEEAAILSMIKQDIKGIILFPADNEDAPNKGIEELGKRNIPVVLIDRSFSKTSMDYVTSDNSNLDRHIYINKGISVIVTSTMSLPI